MRHARTRLFRDVDPEYLWFSNLDRPARSEEDRMELTRKYLVAFTALTLLARGASANVLTCTKTVNALPSVTVDQFPASLVWDLTVTEASCAWCATQPPDHWCHQPGNCGSSAVFGESDGVLEAMTGAPITWAFPAGLTGEWAKFPFWIFNGESVTTSVPLVLSSYADCATRARAAGFLPDTGGNVTVTNTLRVEWNPDGVQPSYATCTAQLVCQPPLGPTRTIGYFRTHPAAMAACVSSGAISLGYFTIAQGATTTALGVLAANPGKYDDGTKRSALDQARLVLARQLLVAVCNGRVFGSDPADTGLIPAAVSALASSTCANLSWLTGQLDAFNNSGDTGQNWFGSATPGTYADPTPRTNLGCK